MTVTVKRKSTATFGRLELVGLQAFALLALTLTTAHGFDYSLSSIMMSLADGSFDFLPSTTQMLEMAKQLVAGYPFEIATTVFDVVCSMEFIKEMVETTPDMRHMLYQLRNNQTFPLLNAQDMWDSSHFDATKNVVMFATGWTTTVDDTIGVLADAYSSRDDINFIAVDVASFVGAFYTWTAFNSEEVGNKIADGLVLLADVLPPDRIHLIGHSLGAHIMGYAGRRFFEQTGKKVARITGLDPAKPCFSRGDLLSGLLRGDAEFIDVIHSNPGVLGKRDPIGDIDFYPGGLDALTPGCLTPMCAHERSWRYFAESVYPGNENHFMAKKCTSLSHLRAGKCGNEEIPMGFATPAGAVGSFFLDVNGEAPFGQGSLNAD